MNSISVTGAFFSSGSSGAGVSGEPEASVVVGGRSAVSELGASADSGADASPSVKSVASTSGAVSSFRSWR